jgi:hypothetical protein
MNKQEFRLTDYLINEIELQSNDSDFNVDMDNISEIKEELNSLYDILPFSRIGDFELYIHLSPINDIGFTDVLNLINSRKRISDNLDNNDYLIQYAQSQTNATPDKITFYLEFHSILKWYRRAGQAMYCQHEVDQECNKALILFNKAIYTDYDICKVIKQISKVSKFLGLMLSNSFKYYRS